MTPEEKAKHDLEQMVKQVREATDLMEAGAKNVGELKEKVAKIEAKLDIAETANQELVKKLNAEKKAAEELAEAHKAAETKAARIPNGGTDEEQVQAKRDMKIFEKCMKHGPSALTEDEFKTVRPFNPDVRMDQKTMSSLSGPDGGFLCPPEYLQEINKKITLISPVRSIARVRSVSSLYAKAYRRDTLVTSYWGNEGADFTPSNSKYARPEILLRSLTGLVGITVQDLWGSAFNMEQEINLDLVEEFARQESEAFVIGSGNDRPMGFTKNTDIVKVASGEAADLTFDAFTDLYGQLKTGYKGVYGMNRLTISRVRKLKDGMGQYLWQVGNMAAGVPNTINGDPYLEMPHMDDIGADKYPVVYGDFSKGYQIVDGLAMSMLRNPYKKEGWVYFSAIKLVGGQVIMPEAFKLLKCAVSV